MGAELLSNVFDFYGLSRLCGLFKAEKHFELFGKPVFAGEYCFNNF